MPTVKPAHHGRRLLPSAGLLCALLAGCGAETYRDRLKETAEYFGYQQKISQELGPSWSVWDVRFQPPRQFRMIAPPPPPDEEDEQEFQDVGEDPRQPHYLGIELPGLLGAWEATVPTDAAEEEHQAFLYVLGNHSRYLDPPDEAGFSEDPQTYVTEVENLITSAIGVILPEGDSGSGREKNQRYREEAPRGTPNSKFTPRKDFTAVTLSPQIDATTLTLPIEMQLYEWHGQKVQVAILMVYPKAISPRERLQDRLLFALETFSATDTPPRAGASSSGAGAPGGGEAPRSTGF